MKTQLKMMIALLLTLATSQVMAINFPTYIPQQHEVYVPVVVETVSMQIGEDIFRRENLTPMINSETGEAVVPYTEPSVSGPHRVIHNPDWEDEDIQPNPLGSAILPLLLLALGYGYIQYKKKELV